MTTRPYPRARPTVIVGAHRTFPVGDRPRVMGIVNVTPDSFSDGGRYLEPSDAIQHALQLATEGASVIDLGAESTRPGARPVSPEAEWKRLAPVLAGLRGRLDVPLSVDTRHPVTVRRAVDAGADLVNDVEGLRTNAMRASVVRAGAAAIVMHMRGGPRTMQRDLRYDDVRREVAEFLARRTALAVRAGLGRDQLLVDPGIGFGKSPSQSLELLVHAGALRALGFPVVVGASRKSFLAWAIGYPTPAPERLEAGLAAAVLAAAQGVALLRTHDVAATVKALAVVAAIHRREEGGAPVRSALR